MFEISKESMGYMDLMGCFSYKFSYENECIIVAYNYDGNQILLKALTNREAFTLTEV